jgi:chromosome segregation ATPase
LADQARIEALQKDKQNIQRQMDALRASLEKHPNEAAKDLGQLHERVSALEQQKSALEAEKKTLEQHITADKKAAQEKATRTEATLEATRSELAKLKEELAAVHPEATGSEAKAEELAKKVSELETSKTKLSADLTAATAAAEQSLKRATKIEAKLHALQESSRQEIEAAHAEHAEEMKEHVREEATIARLTTDNENLQKQIDTIKSHIAQTTDPDSDTHTLVALQDELATLQSQISAGKARESELEHDVTTAREKVARAEDAVTKARAELASTKDQLTALHPTVAAAEAKAEHCAQRIDELEKKNHAQGALLVEAEKAAKKAQHDQETIGDKATANKYQKEVEEIKAKMSEMKTAKETLEVVRHRAREELGSGVTKSPILHPLSSCSHPHPHPRPHRRPYSHPHFRRSCTRHLRGTILEPHSRRQMRRPKWCLNSSLRLMTLRLRSLNTRDTTLTPPPSTMNW